MLRVRQTAPLADHYALLLLDVHFEGVCCKRTVTPCGVRDVPPKASSEPSQPCLLATDIVAKARFHDRRFLWDRQTRKFPLCCCQRLYMTAAAQMLSELAISVGNKQVKVSRFAPLCGAPDLALQ